MMHRLLQRLLLTGLSCFILVLTNCKVKPSSTLEAEHLFSLNLGTLQDEINFFGSSREVLPAIGQIVLSRAGTYYIIDSISKKLMQFNQYGDLLSSIYNPATNFSFTSSELMKTWDFEEIGKIAVSSKHIYIVDKDQRSIAKDNEYLILSFNLSGEFEASIGVQGPNTSPFTGIIADLKINAKDQLIVHLLEAEGKDTFYWFDTDINFIEEISLYDESILGADFASIAVKLPSMEDISILYERLDYDVLFDENTNTEKSIDVREHGVWQYKPKDGTVINQKLFNFSDVGSAGIDRNISMLSTIDGNKIVGININEEGKFILYLFAPNGLELGHTEIEINQSFPYVFDVAHNGLLSCIIYTEDTADVLWWRTDEFLNFQL